MFMLNGKLLGEAFPINKVEVFFDAEDHSDFLGFQWERVSQGKIPIGLDDSDTDFNTIGKTGGEKEVTLDIEHIPPHKHETTGGTYENTGAPYYWLAARKTVGAALTAKIESDNTGGGQAHNNMPPYLVMAFWKRIA